MRSALLTALLVACADDPSDPRSCSEFVAPAYQRETGTPNRCEVPGPIPPNLIGTSEDPIDAGGGFYSVPAFTWTGDPRANGVAYQVPGEPECVWVRCR